MFSVTGLADKLPKMTPCPYRHKSNKQKSVPGSISETVKRVNTLYHGGSQGSCDFVSMAVPMAQCISNLALFVNMHSK